MAGQGSFDQSRDDAHEKREVFGLVWGLRGDRRHNAADMAGCLT